MTLPLNDRVTGPYAATGGETVLDYDFKVMSGADLAVWRRREGAETLLALSVDYVVDGVGSLDGGTIVLADAALAGDEYVIEGVRPATRISDMVAEQGFRASALNAELDSLQAQIAEIRTRVARSIQRSRFDAAAGDLQLPPHAGDGPRAVVVNADGTADLVTFDTIGEGPATWAIPVDWATGLVCVTGPPSTVVSYDAGSGAELYVCVTSHTAGATFAADAGKWRRVAGEPADFDIELLTEATVVDEAADRLLLRQGGANKQVAPAVLRPVAQVQQWPAFGVSADVRGTNLGAAYNDQLSVNNNTLYMIPLHMARARALSRIGMLVTTPFISASARLGLYANHADDKPGTLLLDAGTVDLNSAGHKELTIWQTVDAGFYWMAFLVSGSSFGSGKVRGTISSTPMPLGISVEGPNYWPPLSVSRAATWGALASDESGSTWTLVASSPVMTWK